MHMETIKHRGCTIEVHQDEDYQHDDDCNVGKIVHWHRSYELFGELEDYPPGHRRFFLRKDLV